MLSAQESNDFLTNILEMTADIEGVHQNKERFLNTFLCRFMHVEPFQSILPIAKSPKDRHLPSFQEIKADMFARQGGNCYGLGYFVKEILESLGYDVHYAACKAFDIPKSHIALIVRNLNQQGERHLVDVGTTFPTWKPIPLDFGTVSPIYENGFFSYKFLPKDDDSILFYTKGNRNAVPDFGGDSWFLFYELFLEPCNIETFFENMTKMYTDPHFSPFPYLLTVRAVIYRDNKLFALKDFQQIYENDENELAKEDVHSTDELVRLYMKNFPQFDEDIVRIALKRISISE